VTVCSATRPGFIHTRFALGTDDIPSKFEKPGPVNALRPPHTVLLGTLVLAAVAGGLVVVNVTGLATQFLAGNPTPAAATHPSPSVRGRITAVADEGWTVVTAQGASVTVEIAPDTRFGTARKPVADSAFTVGTSVGVIGTRRADHVVADRIVLIATRAKATPTPTPAT
jgi:Domain of unknown function (DUF5666)